MSHFARVVKGVDLRSTAGNCAWVRTPQVTFCGNVAEDQAKHGLWLCILLVVFLFCNRVEYKPRILDMNAAPASLA